MKRWLVVLVAVLVLAAGRAHGWTPEELEGMASTWRTEQMLFFAKTAVQGGVRCTTKMQELVDADLAQEFCNNLYDTVGDFAARYDSPKFKRWVRDWYLWRRSLELTRVGKYVMPSPPVVPNVKHDPFTVEGLMDSGFVINFLHGRFLALRKLGVSIPSKFTTCRSGAELQASVMLTTPLSYQRVQRVYKALADFYEQSCLLGMDWKMTREQAYKKVQPYWKKAVEELKDL